MADSFKHLERDNSIELAFHLAIILQTDLHAATQAMRARAKLCLFSGNGHCHDAAWRVLTDTTPTTTNLQDVIII